jgi:glutathione peroxidase
VNGGGIHSLYALLTSFLNPIGGDVTWNFQKFLVDRQGNVTAMFNPSISPADKSLVSELEELLKQK